MVDRTPASARTRRPRRLRRRAAALVVGGAVALSMSACAGSGLAARGGITGGEDGMINQLTFPAESTQSIGGDLINFNPYAPNPITSTWLYEPLIVQNGLTCEQTPWLATKATWEGATRLTFDIRQGVTWSDGQPFTAADVAFTFNLAKQYPALDRAGVWTDAFGAPATSVTAVGDQVVFEFSGNAAAKYFGIVNDTKILPEHVYSKVGDPTTYIDQHPVATGPFQVGSYNGRQLVLDRRPDYWQADQVKVKKLVLEGQYDASQAALKLGAGELDAFWGEIPNPERTFVRRDPVNNHFFYAPNGISVLTPNTHEKPYDDPKFREAMAYLMDKESMSLKATYGIMAPASQTGLKLPLMDRYLPAEYAGKDTVVPYDPAKAAEILDAAGYRKGSDGRRTMPDGSKLTVNLSTPAGWIDTQAVMDIVQNSFEDAGITTSQKQISPEALDEEKKSGDFDVLQDYLHGGCDLARGIGAKFDSTQFPDNETIRSNVGRYSTPATDEVVKRLSAATTDAQRKEEVGELVDLMMTQYPVISLTYAPARIIYRSDKAVGWPSAENPYAHPTDNKLLLVTNLRAPGK